MVINMLRALKCRVLGHDFKYNFVSMPSKCICDRCSLKQRFDLSSMEWNDVPSFNSADERTDEQLKSDWFRFNDPEDKKLSIMQIWFGKYYLGIPILFLTIYIIYDLIK